MKFAVIRCQSTQCIAACCVWGCVGADQSECLSMMLSLITVVFTTDRTSCSSALSDPN